MGKQTLFDTLLSMCGINGAFTKSGSEERVERMNKALEHRGPDLSGISRWEQLALGQTLLAIRDKAEVSQQPVEEAGSPWVLLFNGQLYNSASMKQELGPQFEKVDLDTTLLFALIKKHGWEFPRYIHGMYSIALYNKNEDRIGLFRDPSGQKPLYYFLDPASRNFFFSSELSSLLLNPEIPREADPEGLALSLLFGYTPGERTFVKGVRKVFPGQSLVVSLKNFETKKYFFSVGKGEMAGTPKEVFEKLIREHLQSRPKVVLNLSGGLDSSLILHEAASSGYSLETYSTLFEGVSENFNEDAILAKRLAGEYSARHHEIIVTKSSYEHLLTPSLEILEEPDYNISLPIYLETARAEGRQGDGNRVVLSGNGGDEVFGGYPHYRQGQELLLRRNSFSPFPFLFDALKNFRNGTSYRFGNDFDLWQFYKRFLWKPSRSPLPERSALQELRKNIEGFEREHKEKSSPAYDLMFLDRLLWMASENFLQTDKLYMSESLEMRSPLSYAPFREYFDALLSEEDYTGENGNKIFLRKLYEGVLPPYIVQRKKKTGWRAPIEEWYDRKTRDLFLEITRAAPRGEFIDWDRIEKKIEGTEKWPGKYIHLSLSLAVISRKFGIEL